MPTRVSRDLKTALRRFGTATAPRSFDGESIYLDHVRTPLKAFVVQSHPNLAVVCAKQGVADWMARSEDFPRDVDLWGTDFIAATTSFFSTIASRYPLGIVAAVDLDPLGLAQRLSFSSNVFIDGGIDDAWLDIVEADLRSKYRIDDITIRLDRSEQRLLRDIDRVAPLERTVGARSAAMLRSGLKIELEGATNSVLYRRGHLARLHRMLRARTSVAP